MNIVICGAGEVGTHSAEVLTEDGHNVTVVDSDPARLVALEDSLDVGTLLGNGAYYAPDLTKAWLDPGWGTEAAREQLMISFLMDPMTNARTYGTGRRMPQLGITEEEAKGVIAFLKWMSSIDTNGFPRGFKPIRQEESS